MLAPQHEIQRVRSERTILINSPVGEFESNGRIADTIRRVQEKVRTFKLHIEGETGIEIDKMDGFMS